MSKLEERYAEVCAEEAKILEAMAPFNEKLQEKRRQQIELGRDIQDLVAQRDALKGAPTGAPSKFPNRLSEVKTEKSELARAITGRLRADRAEAAL